MRLSSPRHLLTGLVVLWLAVFYPAMCQVHGLMLFRAPAPPEHHRHHPPDMDVAMEMPPSGHTTHATAPAAGSPTPAMRHATLPVSAVVISLLAMALPLETPSWLAQPVTSRWAIVPAFAHQVELSPPDEPPRFLPA